MGTLHQSGEPSLIPTVATMWRSWLLLGGLVLVCTIIAFRSGGLSRIGEGFGSGARLFVSVLPNLVLGFALAGFLHIIVPTDMVVRFMGAESGFRGLCFGTLAGALTPGGPFIHFPVLASFLAKGAGVGPVCAYIAAWALLGVNRFLIWELPILGAQVAVPRLLTSFWVPPLVGWLGSVIHRGWRSPW